MLVRDNPELKVLYCFNNQLKDLDVSKNTALEKLDCGRNKLTKVDLSHNESLTYFSCLMNYVEELDISANQKLVELNCNSNQIKELLVRDNPELKILYCSKNQLKDLDVSKNTALTSLSCAQNKITDLNLETLSELSFLVCGFNPLSDLQLDHNPKLRDLYCQFSNLKILDISNCPEIKSFSNYGCINMQLVYGENEWLDSLLDEATKYTTNHSAINYAYYSYSPSSGYLPLEIDKTTIIFRTPVMDSVSVSGCTVSLNWKEPLGDAYYSLYRRKEAGDWEPVMDHITGYSYVDTGLEADTQYDYRIKAYFAGLGWTDYSSTVSIITEGANTGIDVESFPDETFRQYVFSGFDKNKDNKLSDEELSAVKEVHVDDMGITDLTGVEWFTSLETLSCSHNKLEVLDLSRNMLLTSLDCSYNKLKVLDLSSNWQLKNLNCAINYELYNLDISKNAGLIEVICNNNKISYLELIRAKELEILNCSYNSIRLLDVGFNPELTKLNCVGNWIDLLDLRNNKSDMELVNNSGASIIIRTDEDLGWYTTGVYTRYVLDYGITPKKCHYASETMRIGNKEYYFDSQGLKTDVVVPREITVNPSTLSLTCWDQAKLTAVTNPEGAEADELVWKSEDESIVQVDESGTVTPISVGSTSITVSSLYDRAVMYMVPVTVRPVITPDADELELMTGEGRTVHFSGNTERIASVSFESEDTSVVKIIDDTSVQGISEGVTDVKLTVSDGNGREEYFRIHVTVTGMESMNTDIDRIELLCNGTVLSDENDIKTVEDSSLELTAKIYTSDEEEYEYSFDQSTILTENGSIRLNWTTSNPAVASVNKGRVDVGTAGMAYISAKAVGTTTMSDVIEIHAESRPIELRSLSIRGQTEMEAGSTAYLSATYVPLNTTNKEVIWSSEDESIVSVNEYGMIKALKQGTTKISVTSKEYPDICGSIDIEVQESVARSLRIDKGSASTMDGKLVFGKEQEIEEDDVIILNHTADSGFYICTTASPATGDMSPEWTIIEGNADGLTVQDVTENFIGLTAANHLFYISASEIGESKLKIYASGHTDIAKTITVKVIPYDEWITDAEGHLYHYTNGTPDVGWNTIDGKKYYFSTDGVLQTGWQVIGGKKYYLGTDGALQTGWKKIGGKWYYLGTDGVMQTGWKKLGGKWYHLGTDGVMKTKWQKIGKSWYYFGTDGVMRTGWQKIGQTWYYFGTDGIMVNGWKKLGKIWYYFKGGAMVTGWQKIGNAWYFFKDGAMKTGWLKSGGKWYFFNASGAMVTGSMKIGSKIYQFSSAGVCLNP